MALPLGAGLRLAARSQRLNYGVIDRPFNPILNAKGDSLRRRWEEFRRGVSPLVLNVLLDHL